jgi:mycothiol system anti-sigma-R factor
MNQSNPFVTNSATKPNCREMLQTILDGEATEEQKDYFRQHIGGCMPCYQSYDLEIAIKQLLQTKCCGGEAPSDLVEKIKEQLAQKTV